MLLSTYYENIGDDLIRYGILYLLAKSGFPPSSVGYIAKANPLSVYFPKTPLSHGPWYRMPKRLQYHLACLNNFLSRSSFARRQNKVLNSFGMVVAGTPLFHLDRKISFLGIDQWIPNIFEKCLISNPDLRFFSLGLGSVIDFDPSDIWKLYPAEAKFIKRYVERSVLITTRDETTYKLLQAAAPDPTKKKIIRSICPSVFGYRQLGINREPSCIDENKVCISFTLESSSWNANPEEAKRKRSEIVESIVTMLMEKKITVQLISHNKLDLPLQQKLADKFKLPRPLKATTATMLKEFATSRLVVTWRVHGALGALSLGVPAVLFKTDNRASMAEELGADVIQEPLPTEKVILEQISAAYAEAPERSQNLLNHIDPIRNNHEKLLLERIKRELSNLQSKNYD